MIERIEVMKLEPKAQLFIGILFGTRYWITAPSYLFGIQIPRWIHDKPIGYGRTIGEAWEYAYKNLTTKNAENENDTR